MDNRLKQTLTLIGNAKKGDTHALDEVCRRYLGRVHTIVHFRMGRELRGKTESMDIVQSVMIKAMNGLDGFEAHSESKFINWLSRIVENTIRDKLDFYGAEKRDGAREISIEGSSADENAPPMELADTSSPTVTEDAATREKLARLCNTMDRMKKNHREAVILRNYAGMSFKEVGEVLDCTEDAARMLYVRSMDELTDLLAGTGEDDR